MKCPYCGKEVEEGSKFCDGCGAKLDEARKVESNYEYVYEQPKKSKAGLITAIVIISVLVITGIIVGIILLTSGGKKDKESNESKKKESNPKEEVKTNKATTDKVKYTDYVLENGDIILILENKNSSDISFDVDIEFYDEDKVKVDDDSDSIIGLPAGEKTVLKFYKPDRSYKNYEIKMEATNRAYYKGHYKDLKLTSKNEKEEKEIVVTITNNSTNDVETVKVAALFYKDGKLVGYSYDLDYNITANKAVAMYIYYPHDINYKEIEFDKYEVYLVDAYSFTY